MRAALIGLALAVGIASSVAAQVRADPGVVIGGKVAVRVNVTLADDETPYYPVRGLPIRFTRPPGDTVVGRTDDAGVVTVLLTPGEYRLESPRPVDWNGRRYVWSMPVRVRPDMPAVDLARGNARIESAGNASGTRPTRADSDENRPIRLGDASSESTGSVPWLSIEAGGEGGVMNFDDLTGSDPGYGLAGAFVGGVGSVAVAVGYRYTRIEYGDGLERGTMRGVVAELRYHLRPPATSAVRPYIGVFGGYGDWEGPDSAFETKADMRMMGGTFGAHFGLATSVRLHVAASVAASRLQTSPTSSGLFATGTVGLTFDIFGPGR